LNGRMEIPTALDLLYALVDAVCHCLPPAPCWHTAKFVLLVSLRDMILHFQTRQIVLATAAWITAVYITKSSAELATGVVEAASQCCSDTPAFLRELHMVVCRFSACWSPSCPRARSGLRAAAQKFAQEKHHGVSAAVTPASLQGLDQWVVLLSRTAVGQDSAVLGHLLGEKERALPDTMQARHLAGHKGCGHEETETDKDVKMQAKAARGRKAGPMEGGTPAGCQGS